MAKKPAAPLPIVTARLPQICPSCASHDVARIDSFGIWTLKCQAEHCGWTEKYQVRQP